ncbi:MAG: hypothetical protein ABEJ40_01410, partial [Haloarculaceae archaeon]
MDGDFDASTPQIRPHPSRDGVQVVDPIQDAQFTLLTPDPVEPAACDTDLFYFPVDVAATVPTDTVETPYLMSAWVRDDSGAVETEVSDGEATALSSGRHNVELATTHVKVQLVIDGGFAVEADGEHLRFRLAESDRVHLGARSVHEAPAATVTTTEDPRDVMRALSTLGSALKTTSCERSFPSLRGHPPLVETGASLRIPDWLDVPDTGVTIEVPPSLDYVYPVSTLAYYLGASIEPGDRPRLVTDGWEYRLDREEGFETTVARVLKRVFLLDCVTRTEGYYRVDLHERRVLEDAVDLDFERLYERPVGEQVKTYLDVDRGALSAVTPRWKLTADVQPRAEHASALPFLADELALVRCPASAASEPGTDEVTERVERIFRGPRRGMVRGASARPVRATRAGTSRSSADERVFRPAASESIEQAYIGDGIPVGASKMTVDAYYRRLEYSPSTDPRIRVSVVCNDEEMTDENVVSDIYGTRDWIEFDIGFRDHLTTAEMRDVLRTDTHFLHYIGHVDDEGIRCSDGYLDTRDLDEVNVSAFLLNACDSYDQGRGLVANGAMAGLATVTDVVNKAATSVGRTVAKLLNQGFSLASTLRIVEEYEQIGHHYIVIGDGSTSLVENQSGTPY